MINSTAIVQFDSTGQPAEVDFFKKVAWLSSDWFWETNEEHRFTYISYNAANTYFDHDLAKYIGTRRWENIFGMDAKLPREWCEHIAQLNRHEPFYDFQYENVNKDQKVEYASISGVPRFHRDGRFIGYYGIGSDRTLELQTKNSLTRLFRHNPMPMVIFDSEDSTILDGNDKFISSYKYHLEEMLHSEIDLYLDQQTLEFLRAQVAQTPIHERIKISDYAWLKTGTGDKVQAEVSASLLNYEGKIAYCCVIIDLSERIFVEELRRSEQRFRTLYDENPTSFFTLDRDLNILSMNAYGLKTMGYCRTDLIGQSVLKLYAEKSVKKARQSFRTCFKRKGAISNCVVEKTCKNGDKIWTDETCRTILDEDGQLIALCVAEDVTQREKLAQQLKFEAFHDTLTGVLNRRGFEQEMALLKEQIQPGQRHALLYFDLDRFKIVNDTMGHSEGDKLIQSVAQIVKRRIGKKDIIGRLGGDEFGLIIKNVGNSDCTAIAKRILEAVRRQHFTANNTIYSVTASVGITYISSRSGKIEQIQSQADIASYIAKRRGGNCHQEFRKDDYQVRIFSTGMQSTLLLSQAIDHDRLALARQEIIPRQGLPKNGSSRRYFEMLLRLKMEDSYISPSEFLSGAEDFNFSSQVDKWVMETTFRWYKENCPNDDEIYSINVSRRTMEDESLALFLKNLILQYEVPAENFIIELTETVYSTNSQSALKLVEEISALGIRLALDDFGKGFSSYSELVNLPLDFVKIDGEFIRNIESVEVNRQIVESICKTANHLDILTIAEKVETEASCNVLEAIGVDFCQGQYLASPQIIFPQERACEVAQPESL